MAETDDTPTTDDTQTPVAPGNTAAENGTLPGADPAGVVDETNDASTGAGMAGDDDVSAATGTEPDDRAELDRQVGEYEEGVGTDDKQP